MVSALLNRFKQYLSQWWSGIRCFTTHNVVVEHILDWATMLFYFRRHTPLTDVDILIILLKNRIWILESWVFLWACYFFQYDSQFVFHCFWVHGWKKSESFCSQTFHFWVFVINVCKSCIRLCFPFGISLGLAHQINFTISMKTASISQCFQYLLSPVFQHLSPLYLLMLRQTPYGDGVLLYNILPYYDATIFLSKWSHYCNALFSYCQHVVMTACDLAW